MANELPRTETSSRFRTFIVNVFYVALAIGLAALIQAFIIRPFIVSGNSMDPIIKDREYLIVDEITFKFDEPQRGEVIVFKAPPEPTKYYIKRIIGLPGETVQSRNGVITIFNATHPNGFTLSEPYITHTFKDDFSIVVPEGTYFVMGDNRAESYDSRGWGPLPAANIRGRALLRLLPLDRINYLPGEEHYTNE